MRNTRVFLSGLACLVLMTATARSETPSPLRLIPDQADLFLEIQHPRELVNAFLELDLVEKLKEFPAFEEQLESTNVRRFYQLVSFFEKELGADWPTLLDKVAGGGMVLASKIGGDSPVLFVIQGKDKELTAKFTKLVVEVVEQELKRQESKARFIREKMAGYEVLRLGDGFYACAVDDVILVSNKAKAIQAGLALHAGKETKSLAKTDTIKKLGTLLPESSLARFWLNMDTVRKNDQVGDLYAKPRDPFVTVVLGEYIELLAQTPFVSAAFSKDSDGLVTSIRFPIGKEKMGAEKKLHLPPKGMHGALPLLEPKNVLLSDNFYFDFASLWNDRVGLFGEQNAKGLEEADKATSKIPFVKLQLSKIFQAAGPYHRFVVVDQPKAIGYKREPGQPLPAAAFVTQMRKPDEFSRTIESLVRAGGLLASSQVKMKLVEEEYKGVKIIGYRFSEKEELAADPTGFRFSTMPCMVRVNDQLVISSTFALARELVDILQTESAKLKKLSLAHSRTRLYAAGIAKSLEATKDQLVTQIVLDQAVPIENAARQVEDLLRVLSTAGSLQLESVVGDNDFRYDIRYKK